MSTFTVAKAVAWLAAAGWIGISVARGKFWDAGADRLAEADPVAPAPEVHAVIPARNEADVIARTLAALAAQRYPGRFHATVVDDRSDDGTGAAARDAIAAAAAGARFATVTARDRPAGWTGKVWAMAEGVAAAERAGASPAYWWFTDADVVHDPQTLARLVATARERDRDLVSLMVALHCRGPWERLLIPAFVFFFRMLYPFAWVNDDRRATAGAAGGCILLDAAALARIGGLSRIAGELIDDCALASAVKRDGGRLWLGLATRSQSIRPYGGLAPIWAMVARTAYTQLGYAPAALAGTVAAMTLLYVAPPLALGIGLATRRPGLAFPAALAWGTMTLLYLPTVRRYGCPPWIALTLPFAGVLYTAMTVDSARLHAGRSGGAWKGRTFTPGA
jgi:hopene-associated glycosyltransferase HpnB